MFEAGKTLYKYEQTWAPALRTFPLWIAFKVVFNAFILNYTASSFIVSDCPSCVGCCRQDRQPVTTIPIAVVHAAAAGAVAP